MADEGPTHGAPPASPVEPVELGLESRMRFDCHPGVACFNACCRSTDITLTPYDVVRLKRRLGMGSGDFVAACTYPFEMDAQGMPGLKLAHKPGTGECLFLEEWGCRVYEDRPAACRYYALGNMGVRRKDADRVDDLYFLIREAHCLGHGEPKTRTVAEYRREQGVDVYDDRNREWRDIVIKKRSSGPAVGKPSARSRQLFGMCSYDVDAFREFVSSRGFRDLFDLDEAAMEGLRSDEDALLAFAFRFLKQVLFGEMTIPVKPGARERRIAQRREVWRERREAETRRWRDAVEEAQYGDPEASARPEPGGS